MENFFIVFLISHSPSCNKVFFMDPFAHVGKVMLGEIKRADEGQRTKQQESLHFNPPVLTPG